MSLTISIPTTNRYSFSTTLSSVLTSNYRGLISELHVIYIPKHHCYVTCDLAKHIYSVLEREGIKIKLIKQHNKGIGKARAIQLSSCNTHYLLLLDDDAILTTDCMYNLMIEMQRDYLNITAIMPLMLCNYDPNNQLGKTFINMDKIVMKESDFENDSFSRVLFPFMNHAWNSKCLQEYDILYAICCLIDMNKFDKSYPVDILSKWSPSHGYEDRWFGKYLLSKGCKIYVAPYTHCYHFMEPAESRKWSSEIDCGEELKLLKNLLHRPFLESQKTNI